ncbi:MAG: aminotransferase class III-fold pyridoxal phosphate-dependent enzyme [bacterium]
MVALSTAQHQLLDPSQHVVTATDQQVVQTLSDFLPNRIIDIHTHLYSLTDSQKTPTTVEADGVTLRSTMSHWLEQRVEQYLSFPFPLKDLPFAAANEHIFQESHKHDFVHGLMIIGPTDDPDQVRETVQQHSFRGFKCYHHYASRNNTFEANIEEFLPDWAWEIADQQNLIIMLHLVKAQALSDPNNLSYLQDRLSRFKNAKLVLAHCARGFAAKNTIEGLNAVRQFENVFFDSSAVCEPTSMEAIIRATGITRLMYGSDYPVSQMRGKAISLANGFKWLNQSSSTGQDSSFGEFTLVGIESLLALQVAAQLCSLKDSDLEYIFYKNAFHLLGLGASYESKQNLEQYELAKTMIPGGTQLLSKKPELMAPNYWPAYYTQATGCEIIDEGGNRFLDMASNAVLSCLLGYADPDVNNAVLRRVQLGSMSSLSNYDEVRLAERLLEIHPWAQMVRYARTGGEAMTMAVRIARAVTGRDKVAICGYHGWHDWYLAVNLEDGPNGLQDHLLPGLDPLGVPAGLKGTALPFRYNQLAELEEIFAHHQLAAVVMETTRGVEPENQFLEKVRQLATQHGTKLIFDEISIGWRLCLGGAHLKYHVTPDLAVFAKALSNGYPMGAVIGQTAEMKFFERTFISSAYWSESIGPTAALAAVEKMMSLDVPAHLQRIGGCFMKRWLELGQSCQLPTFFKGRPELVQLGFEHEQANRIMTLFTRLMLQQGIMAGSSFNPTFAHQDRHLDHYFEKAEICFDQINQQLKSGQFYDQEAFETKHTGFARLVN